MNHVEELIRKEENGTVVLLNKNNGCWVRMKSSKYADLIADAEKKAYLEMYLNEKFHIFEENKKAQLDIKSIYYSVTGKCNMNCAFCTMNSGPYVSTENDISLEEIENVIIPKLRELTPNKIVITGGEPLIRNDILDILKLFSRYFGKESIILQTNGLLLMKDFLEKIVNYIGTLEISIENIFENSRLLDQMKENFETANAHDIILSLSFVVDEKSRKYLKDAIEICHTYKAAFIPRVVSLLGRAKENSVEDEILTQRNTLDVHYEIACYLLEKKYFEDNLTGILFGELSPKSCCGAFGKILSIHPDGTAFMCGNFKDLRYSFGNIKNQPLENLLQQLRSMLEDASYQQQFFIEHIEMCKDCEAAYFCYGPCSAEKAENEEHLEVLESKCLYRKILIQYLLFYYQKEKTCEENLEQITAYMRTFLAG